jgi:hypothetical protein
MDRSVSAELVFKEPVTLRMVEQACAILGVAMDDVFDSPVEALANKGVPLSNLREFMQIVLEDVPDLDAMSIEEAEALATYAAADFFLNVYMRRLAERTRVSSRFGRGAAFRMAQAQ